MTMTLAQIESAAKASEAVVAHYGQLAFSLVALIVIVSLLIAAWIKVGMPSLAMVIKISENLSNATSNIKATTDGQARMAETLASSLQRIEDHRERLKEMLDDIRGEDEHGSDQQDARHDGHKTREERR
jgi:hypothetical protein